MRAGLAPRCGRDSRRDAGSTHPTPTTINRETKTRGHRTPKGYICLMICTTVHENSQAPICRMGGIGHILYPGNRKGRPYRWVGTFQVSNHLSTYYPRTWGPEGVQPCLAGGERSEPPDGKTPHNKRPRRGRIAHRTGLVPHQLPPCSSSTKPSSTNPYPPRQPIHQNG